MKRILTTLAVLGGLFTLGATAQAQDWRGDHFHNELSHRASDREQYSREAHRYPMTPGQHAQLHDRLEHEEYHDQLADQAYHRGQASNRGYPRYAPQPSYPGHSYYTPQPRYGYPSYPAYPSVGRGQIHHSGPRHSFSLSW
jgi:hypothetical protein